MDLEPSPSRSTSLIGEIRVWILTHARILMRGSSASVEHRSHKPAVAGSNPAPAPNPKEETWTGKSS